MAQDDSDSESGLPEIFSFSTSASVAKGQHDALRTFHAAEKRKIKERNRQHDKRLKAQANMRRRTTATTGESSHAENHEVETGDNESGSHLDPRLHWRMTRAMGDAEGGTEESDGANVSADEWGGINVAGGQDVEMSSDEGTEETEGKSRNPNLDSGEGEGEGDDDDDLGALHLQPPSRNYLPDHIFVTSRPKVNPENDVRISQTMPKTRSTKKRHPVRARRKDVVVGTRTVRTLSSFPASVHVQSQGTTLRPAHIDKFLTNAHRLEGKILPRGNASRWERRPSHLGVMKRAVGAPVTGFARKSQC